MTVKNSFCAVTLPVTLALAVERGFIEPNEHIALLGIGSGINCVMLAVDWQRSPTAAGAVAAPHFAASLSPPAVNRRTTSASK